MVFAPERSRFPVLDPSDGSVIESVGSATAEDGIAAVDAAAAAAADWAARAPRERAQLLRGAFDLMTERLDSIAHLIVREMGKPLAEARGEAAYAAEFLRWFSEEAVRVPGDYGLAPAGTNRMLVGHAPIGVSLLITPWNFPAAMATRKIGPALAAGCTVILKPAEETPLTAIAIGELLLEAGIPEGVVNVVTTDDPGPLCEAILADPRVRKLSFTGSTAVGRHLLGLAGRSVISTSMELGGNAPFLVLEDADLDVAVREAMAAKMRNGGEACTAANRFLVHESVAEAFAARLTDAMSAVRVAPGFEEGAQLGPLINADARAKVERLVADAVERGARVRCGGERLPGPGFFYPPTVLDAVQPGSALLREEIFGPVAPIMTFTSEDEAVQMANDTEYGLVAFVCSRDLRRAMAIGERIETGMVGLNRGVVSDPAAPFGGAKQSGLGREGGHHGLLEFLEPKYFAFD
ncbi:NAD-dependent succinate-semialdehyde dehydrogenase [Solirubrobacter sp. CPCC 204708]|uniref:NAD-dependent succinate-semialdehyde dehydrogenase n=1 Tax=Solirubrobacter deserti TaxID=2282478 RepID=A0ABT4RHK0_9ACTN|nr:NAD-dependent succinate-semialdehyde dehydrogenase [Solirubrobacter deserti]MBE2316491.1 NAD-dependent succinate-semialdehyde dehydrogenase [Solirubrobacter deserti]MDA0138024.1 NAD-dependent succinate-semialdehyde dehydrogenase [Solirubrobacter deserti]